MKYKAIMLDVDGTLVPYDYDALPSKKVVDAIKKAQEKVYVCLVTGRSFAFTQLVLKKLEIKSGYAVVNNGAQVVKIPENKVLYDRPIEKDDAKKIIEIFSEEGVKFYLKQDLMDLSYKLGYFNPSDEIHNPNMFITDENLSEEKVERILNKLSDIHTINAHKTVHKEPGKFGINISHLNATKLHGIEILIDKLKLKKEEIIGVGDSYNDFPLLMACGLKVAMGNAIDDLKAIADYVAPPVTKDGVADVIERFILSDSESI